MRRVMRPTFGTSSEACSARSSECLAKAEELIALSGQNPSIEASIYGRIEALKDEAETWAARAMLWDAYEQQDDRDLEEDRTLGGRR